MIEVIRGLESLKNRYENLVLTIGNFDGIHIGHQRILKKVVERAKALRGVSMAMSFEPHPMRVLTPERELKLMTTTEEKTRIMESLGIEKLLLVNFTKEFAHLEPDEFVERVLMGKLSPKEIVVGHNYAFGRGRKGTNAILRRRGRKYGFRLTVVRHARWNGKVVSSSRTRMKLEKGKVADAAQLLGRPFVIEGTVIKGAGRGASLLGYPTANISTTNELVPKEGVYAVKVRVKGKLYDGVANIGTNPTFGNNRQSVEVFILDFHGEILGHKIRLYFLDRLRDEQAFPRPEALREAISKDIEEAKKVFKGKRKLNLI